MPTLPKDQAAEELARVIEVVEESKPTTLAEIYGELFPKRPAGPVPTGRELANHIRGGLEAEEIVDLWNVVFPKHRNVWYDEEENKIHYNEELAEYGDSD